MRCQQAGEEHARDAQFDAFEAHIPQPDAREHDDAQNEQIMGDGRGLMQAMEKGHVSISSGMKSASRPTLLHADLVMRRLAFTARDLAWA